MRALARFLRSEGWLVETLAAFVLTIGLIAGRQSEGGITGRAFGSLIDWLGQAGFNPRDNDGFLWLALLGNLALFATVSYAYRGEIERLAHLIATALRHFPENSRYHVIHSLLVTSALAAVFTAVAATGGAIGEWISTIAVTISGKEDFYLLRVPICFCLAYPFFQCAVAAKKVARTSGNHHQDFPGGKIH